MKFCFIGLLLIIQNANAACEAEKDKWQSFVTACERAQAASGAMGIGCAIFMGPLGGLFSIPMAIEAATQGHLATLAKGNYDNCMERHRRDQEARIAKEAEIQARAQRKHQWAYEWSMNQAKNYRESAIRVAESTAIWAIEKKIKAMQTDGIDLSNREVIQAVEAIRADVAQQLEAYKQKIIDKYNQRIEKIEKAWANKEEPASNCRGAGICTANCENSRYNWYYESVGFPQPYESFEPSVN